MEGSTNDPPQRSVRVRTLQMTERRGGAPVALARGVHVKVGRGPVLEQRGGGIPALTPVHPLQITVTAPARLDEVALLAAFRDQSHEVGRFPRLTERAPESRPDPDPRAQETREPP